jgi:hypothetical protein
MNNYCTFHLVSNTKNTIPEDLLYRSKSVSLQFTDNKSPDRLSLFNRLKKNGVKPKKNLQRFHWYFSSERGVRSVDISDHVLWIFSRIRDDYDLAGLREIGYDYWIQFFFEGNGSGGGPVITNEIAKLLFENEISLTIGFYYSEPE